MCVCGVSSVIILELEFYSNGQGIAVLRSSIDPGLADTVVKPRCSAGELRAPIFRLTNTLLRSFPQVEAASPEPDLPWHMDLFTIAEDGASILPDEDESRYGLRLWLELLVEHFFKPAGYVLNGEVHWTADELDDRGSIFVKDNLIEAVVDVVINPGPSWSPERFADKQLTDLVRELVESSDATGCSPDLTVVSAQSVEALRTALPRMEDFAMMLE
jgi:hypothetical protein